jgi:hypothetical protein
MVKLEVPTVVKAVEKGKAEKPRTSLSLYKSPADSPNQHIRALLKPEHLTKSDYDIVKEWMGTDSPNKMVELILYTAIKDLGYLNTPKK